MWDPHAWYHIVVAIDTTQATASDRVKIYINGEQETDLNSSTYPDQDSSLNFNYSEGPIPYADNYYGGWDNLTIDFNLSWGYLDEEYDNNPDSPTTKNMFGEDMVVMLCGQVHNMNLHYIISLYQ